MKKKALISFAGETTHGRNDPGRNDPGRNDPRAKRLTGETTHGRNNPVPITAKFSGVRKFRNSTVYYFSISLEKKVRHLKRENDALRSSASLSFRPSDSTSPTPASLSSHNSYTETCIKALQEAQVMKLLSSLRAW